MAIVSEIMTYLKAANMRFRGMCLTLLLRSMGCKVGKGLRAAGWPVFRLYPSGNSTILMGVHLPEGAIVGANSVLSKSVTYEVNGIYAGVPAKLLRYRT